MNRLIGSGSGPGGQASAVKLSIFNLPEVMTEQIVRDLLSQFGKLRMLSLIRDLQTGKIKGYGIFEYDDPRDSDLAIIALNGFVCGQNVIRVQRLGGQQPGQAAPAKAPAAAPAGGDMSKIEADIKAVADEIRTLKDSLKAKGMSGAQINSDAGIKALVDKLNVHKAAYTAAGGNATAPAPKAAASPKAAPSAAPSGGESVDAVADQIRSLKEKLKADGLSGKQVNNHPEVTELVKKLSALKEAAASAPAFAISPTMFKIAFLTSASISSRRVQSALPTRYCSSAL